MASNFTTAYIGLGVDTKEFTKDIKDVSTKTEAALRTMKLSADAFDHRWGDLTRGIKDTKRIVSGILVSQGFYALSNVLVGAGMSALTFSKNMETAAISMEYFVKGADKVVKAQAFIKTMNEFAARTPFTTEQSLALSKYMQAVGVSMNTTKSFLKVITDTAAATGATEENLQRIVFGLGQMMTKGRLANEEIRQLANANIPIYEILQQELNLTGTQIAKIGKSWVSSDKAVTAILTGLDKRYKGAADRISDTMTGMTDTILDNAKIIAQVGFEGVFSSAKTKMTGLRDVLDTYREVVSEGIVVTAAGKKVAASLADAQGIAGKYYVGSAGLLEYILRQIDASGEFGDAIVDLIGNTRQLGIALGEAYRAAQPVVRVIGQSFYAATTVSLQALTSFSKAVAGGARGLTNLGIASEITGKTIASLYITYKAASWISFLGQGAISAAYSLYKMAASIGSVIPPILGASVAMKTLTGGLIGAVALGLSAAGVFNAVNDALSGVAKTMQNGGSLFDYDEVKKYMDSLAAYQEAYEAPYTEIANGAETAINGFEDVADASAAAAKSVKKDWVASFDEVYSLPEMEANKANFSDFLKAPTYDFSALDAFATAMSEPKIDWESMFGTSLWDSELASTSFWYSLIPLFGVSVAANLGKMFAKMRDEAGKSPDGTPWEAGKGPKGTGGIGGTGGGASGLWLSPAEATRSLKELQNTFTGHIDAIEKLTKRIAAASNEEAYILLETLNDQISAADKLLLRAMHLQTLTGDTAQVFSSAALEQAKNLVALVDMNRQATIALASTQSGAGSTYAAEEARRVADSAIRSMERIYSDYVRRVGSASPELINATRGLIDYGGTDQRVEALVQLVAKLNKQLFENGYNATKVRLDILAANKLSNRILAELDAGGVDPTYIEKTTSMLDRFITLLEQQQAHAAATAQKIAYEDLLARSALYNELADKDKTSKVDTALLSDKIKGFEEYTKKISADIGLIKADIWLRDPEFNQQAITYALQKKAYATLRAVANTLDSTALKALKAYSKYEALVFDTKSGQAVLKDGIVNLKNTLSKLQTYATEGNAIPLERSLTRLYDLYSRLLAGERDTIIPSFEEVSDEIIGAFKIFGEDLGVISTSLDEGIQALSDRMAVGSGTVTGIDNYIATVNALEKSTATYQATVAALANERQEIIAFNKQLHGFATTFPLINTQLYNQLATDAKVQLLKAFSEDVVPSISEKLNSLIDANRAHLVDLLQAAGRAPINTAPKVESLDKILQIELTKLNNVQALSFNQIGTALRAGIGIDMGARWKGTPAEISGLFKLASLGMSGTDAAAMESGRTGYGYTVPSSAAGNLSEAGKIVLGTKRQNYVTVASRVAMAIGRALEEPVGGFLANTFAKAAALAEFVRLPEKAAEEIDAYTALTPAARLGYGVMTGGTFSTPDQTALAQIDYLLTRFDTLLTDKQTVVAPMDTKILFGWEQKYAKQLADYSLDKLDGYKSEFLDTLRDIFTAKDMPYAFDPEAAISGTAGQQMFNLSQVYAIAAENLSAITAVVDDLPAQILLQAAIIGSKFGVLAITDYLGAGLPRLNPADIAMYHPVRDADLIDKLATVHAQKAILQELKQGGTKLLDAQRFIAIEISEDMRKALFENAKLFQIYQQKLAAAYLVDPDTFRKFFETQLSNGMTIVLPDTLRTLPKDFFSLPHGIGGAVNDHLNTLIKLAKSSDSVLADSAIAQLRDFNEKLSQVDLEGRTQFTPGQQLVGVNIIGQDVVLELSVEDKVQLYSKLEKIINTIDEARSSSKISISDLITTANRRFAEASKLGELLTTNTLMYLKSDSTPVFLKDILESIRKLDKNIVNDGQKYSLLTQYASSFIEGGAMTTPLPNPYKPLTVRELVDMLPSSFANRPDVTALLADTTTMINQGLMSIGEVAKVVDSIDNANDAAKMLNFISKGGFVDLKASEHLITFLYDFFTKGLTFSADASRVAESTAGLSALFNLLIDANPEHITQVVGEITKWLPNRLTTAFTDFAIKAAQALNANALPIIGANGMLPQVVSTMSGFGNNYFQAGIVRDMEGAAKFFLRTGENLFDVTRVGAISAAEQAGAAMHSFATRLGYNSDFIDKFVTDYVSHVSKYVSWGSFTGADDLSAAAGKSLGDAAENLDEAARLLKGSVGWAITFSADDLAKFLTSAGKWASYVGLGIGYIGELVEGYKIRVARDEMLANSKYSGGDAYYVAKSAVDMLLSAISPGALLSTRSGEAQVMQDYWRMNPDEQLFWGGTQFTSTQDSVLAMLFGGKRGDFGASYSERLIVDARETAAKLGMNFAEYVQQELNKKSDLAKVIDYIVRSGDIHSNIAKAFYREFSDIFETVIRPAFVNITAEWERQGKAQYTSVSNWDRQNQGLLFGANEWAYKNMPKLIQEAVSNAATQVSPEFYDRWTSTYANGDVSPADGSAPQQISVADVAQAARAAAGMDATWNANVNALITSGGEQIQQLMIAMFGRGLASASEATWEMKPMLDDILKQVVDSVHTQFRPLIAAANQNVSANFGSDPEYARVFAANLSDMMDSFAPQLATTFGMSFTQLSEGIAKMSVNIAEVSDNIAGFRFKMPDEFKIEQAKLTTTDMAVLAQAGIQINSDGTVSVMTAQRNNTVGAVREVDLRAGQLAQDTLNKLATGGININFGEEGAALDFDISTIAKNMRSALFALTGAVDPSPEEVELLAGLGNFDSSGMFEVTNQAVLSGTQTIAGYFKSLGAAATANFGETRRILEDIDAVIALGGEASRETIAKMADGITVFSPILAKEMTTGLDTAFTLAGASFVEHGKELILAVNHLGERLNHGVTVLTEEAYRSLSDKVKALLTAWGVLTKEEAGMVLLDTSNVIKAGQVEMLQVLLSDPSIYSSMPVALQEALQAVGIAMQDGLVSIDLSAHDGLLRLSDNWYTSWNALSEDTVAALNKVNMDTSTGLLKVEKLITDSGIPEALDGQIVAKFEDLPKQIQDSLLTGDDSVDAAIRDSVYRVEQTTSESFMGVVNAVTLAFKDANTAAKEGVEELGESLISSMLLTQQITNAISHGVGTSGGFGNPNISWGPGSQKNTIDNVGTTRGGITYYKERNIAGDVVAEWHADPTTGLFKREVIKQDDVAGAKVTYNPDRAARGGLITEHAIYQAGEFGRKEAVVPLENRSVLAKVGQAVGTFVPAKLTAEQMSTIMSGVTVAVLDQIYSLQTALSKGPETNHEDMQKLSNDLAELFNKSDTVTSELFANLGSTIRASTIDITSALTELSFDITGALSNLRQASSYSSSDTSYTPETDISDPLSSVGKENYPYTPGMHKGDPVANALLTDAVANLETLPFTPSTFSQLDLSKTVEGFTTSVSDLTAQAYADEMLRTLSVIENRKAAGQNLDNQYAWLQGLMNVNTNATATLAQHAALEAVKEYYKDAIYTAYDVKGSARGSLVTKDALYRAGEFGLNEAIIPLENPSVMRLIGESIYNSIPKITSLPPNGGLVNPEVRRQETYDMSNQEALVASTTRRVLEAVLPAIVSTEAEPVTPVYVGTLIADEQGLKMLERKLYDVRLQEERRRK